MLLNLLMGVISMPYIFNTEHLTPHNYYQLDNSDPNWFLFHCRAGGFQFEVVNANLKISPAHSIDDEMQQLLKQNKAIIISVLESEMNDGN